MTSELTEGRGGEESPKAPRRMVTVGGREGYLFKSAGASSYCFVPAGCIHVAPSGGVKVDEIAYFKSGWGTRNMRCSDVDADGKFIFPDTDQAVTDLEHAEVRRFLERIS